MPASPTSTHIPIHMSEADRALWRALYSQAVMSGPEPVSPADCAESANLATEVWGVTRGLLSNPPPNLDSDAAAILDLVLDDSEQTFAPLQPIPSRLKRARELAQETRPFAARQLGMTPEELAAAEQAQHGAFSWTVDRLKIAAHMYMVTVEWLTDPSLGETIDDMRPSRRHR